MQATPLFKQAGINILHPVLGLNSVWLESGEYDWARFDEFFDQLLALHPQAFFLPRVQLDVPEWWKKSHPDEMIVPAIPIGTERNERYHKAELNPGGGWLFDFGTRSAIRRSWYDDQPILEEVQKFSRLGEMRKGLDLDSVAEIAAIYDAKSLFVTRHWKAEEPYSQGADCMDYFSYWFLDSQARAFHRIGAPVDFLYRFDLKPLDVKKYCLFFMA